MRLNEGVEWAAHCLALLAALPEEMALSATRLAEYHAVPAPYLAKSLQALAGAGLISSRVGRHGGYRLTRPAQLSGQRRERCACPAARRRIDWDSKPRPFWISCFLTWPGPRPR